ncbi:MAG: hypothetical protein HYX63_01495 [Gammaproteobacteria bacterium]|nr:hypothetical protein [Gammaproteobacteria bacterium]
MSLAETKSNVVDHPASAERNETDENEQAAHEIEQIVRFKADTAASNKEVAACYDRLEKLGFDRDAVKAWLKRQKRDESRQQHFDATMKRLATLQANFEFDFAA